MEKALIYSSWKWKQCQSNFLPTFSIRNYRKRALSFSIQKQIKMSPNVNSQLCFTHFLLIFVEYNTQPCLQTKTITAIAAWIPAMQPHRLPLSGKCFKCHHLCRCGEQANIRLCKHLAALSASVSSHLVKIFWNETQPSVHPFCVKIRHFPGGCPVINQVAEEESFGEIGQPVSWATTGPPHASLQSLELLRGDWIPSPSALHYLPQVLYEAAAWMQEFVCMCEEWQTTSRSCWHYQYSNRVLWWIQIARKG